MAQIIKIGPKTCLHCGGKTYFTQLQKFITNPSPPPTLGGRGISISHKVETSITVVIYECDGCHRKELHFAEQSDSPKILWPSHNRKLSFPDEIKESLPANLIKDFQEAAAIEILSPTASATISRRCLQSILINKFPVIIGTRKKLKAQVEAVLNAKCLPEYIAEELHGIRSIGNKAAHENVDPETNEIIEIEPQEASACLDAISTLVQFLYVDPFLAGKRKADREKKFGPDNQ